MKAEQKKTVESVGVECSEEILLAFRKCTPLAQDIAINHLKGMTNGEAYRNAKHGKASTPESMRNGAGEILANPAVKHFLDLVRNKRVRNTIMTREEAIERLTAMARANINDVIEVKKIIIGTDNEGKPKYALQHCLTDAAIENPELMNCLTEINPTSVGIKYKMHDQKAAMKQISDMEGWNAAQKHEITGKDGGAITTKELADDDYLSGLGDLGA